MLTINAFLNLSLIFVEILRNIINCVSANIRLLRDIFFFYNKFRIYLGSRRPINQITMQSVESLVKIGSLIDTRKIELVHIYVSIEAFYRKINKRGIRGAYRVCVLICSRVHTGRRWLFLQGSRGSELYINILMSAIESTPIYSSRVHCMRSHVLSRPIAVNV